MISVGVAHFPSAFILYSRSPFEQSNPAVSHLHLTVYLLENLKILLMRIEEFWTYKVVWEISLAQKFINQLNEGCHDFIDTFCS